MVLRWTWQSCTLTQLLAATVLHSLIIFLHPTASATHQQTATVYLLSVRNSRSTSGDSGVDIIITPSSNYYEPPNGENTQPQQTYFIPNRSLSSECGDQYFRCQKLVVETFLAQDGRELDIVFVPLENGVLLVSIWRDYCTGMLEWSEFIVDSPTVTCSPTVIYKAGGSNSLYTVCVSTRDPHMYASVYQLDFRLNGSEIESGSLSSQPLTAMTFMTNQTLKLSNFLVKVSGSQENMVYFAVGGSILVLDVFDPTMTKKYHNELPCSQINKLVSDESGRYLILLAFCNDRAIYFDPVYGDWIQIYTFSTYGIPFLCPSSSYKVTFFNDESRNYLQLSSPGSVPIIIHNVTVSSGICFEIQNRTYFAYSDRQQSGVFLYNFDAHTSYMMFSYYECSNSADCPRLSVLENRFLVIRDTNNVFVIDSKDNFRLMINDSQDTSLIALLHLLSPLPFTTCMSIPSLSWPSTTSMKASRTKVNTVSHSPFANTSSLRSLVNSKATVTQTIVPRPVVHPSHVAVLTGTLVSLGVLIIVATLSIVIAGIWIRFWCRARNRSSKYTYSR